ncbi:MAG: ABC transporter ATP-binding protein [Deltaproteobacteria bacterium]|nr:MAG: ABC transporter ATP-binding protein [Deltaproteobacteria bacterium]
MDVIESEGLTKRFGDVLAVDNVTFRVREGEIFGFLGPNGAGKTTTINMLITLMRPTKGSARVAGYDIIKEPDKVRKKIGVVFQDPTLDRRLTGWENLYIHGRLYGIPSRELKLRIKELFEFVELKGWENKIVQYYSGGMMRRLEIARALLYNPEILFLDEPTLGLDPQSRAKVWDYIREIKSEEGMTIFLTTHYMEEAEKLCDRVAIIDYGRIIALGTVEELKSKVGNEIIYLNASPNGHKRDFIERIRVLDSIQGLKVLKDGVISLSVNNAPETIPIVLQEAQKLGVEIKEVRYLRPSLEDVFLQLTGKGLRDEEASFFDHIRMRRMRMRRRR